MQILDNSSEPYLTPPDSISNVDFSIQCEESEIDQLEGTSTLTYQSL